MRHYPTFRLHSIDYALPQVYNAFVIIVPCERQYLAWGKMARKPRQYHLLRATGQRHPWCGFCATGEGLRFPLNKERVLWRTISRGLMWGRLASAASSLICKAIWWPTTIGSMERPIPSQA